MASSSSPSSSNCFTALPSHSSFTRSLSPLHRPFNTKLPLKTTTPRPRLSYVQHIRATRDDEPQISTTPSLLLEEQTQPNKEVEECVRVLKNAAMTRKVTPEEILNAFSVIEKAKLDPSGFFETLGGTKSPGRTWMLVFTAQIIKKLGAGRYFPITAVQRFDAAGKRIENGVYFRPLGSLTFEGRLSWKKRILAFIFERIRIKIGPLSPFELSFKGDDEREPNNTDPFFIWFYIDEEIVVARGRSGGTAFWVRCKRVEY